jgi:hypothetical protein
VDLVSRIANTRFLGREFLTWLWYRSELQEGLFRLGEDRTIEVWFDARLTLEALGDIKEQNVIKSESPTETEEARASLQTGKQVKEARLRVVYDQKQWTATIKADDLSLHGLKLPAVLSREEDDQVYERFDLLEEIAFRGKSPGVLILRLASRLDAFSGYPFRLSYPAMPLARQLEHQRSSIPVLSY